MTSILKVSTLKDPTNSNTALSIDASGRVTTPARPAFFAAATSNVDIATAATDQKVGFTEQFDIGDCYDNANSRFIAPCDGVYHFNFNVTFACNSSSVRYVRTSIYKNGTDTGIDAHGQISNEAGDSDYDSQSFGIVMQLVANDYIEVYAASSLSAVDIVGFGSATNFSGHLVG